MSELGSSITARRRRVGNRRNGSRAFGCGSICTNGWLDMESDGGSRLYGRPSFSLVSAAIYICLALHPELGGIRPKLGGPMLSYASTWDWLRSVFYSFRAMTLLKPEDLEAIRWAKLVYMVDSLLGPTLLGLFALALRQRLKR